MLKPSGASDIAVFLLLLEAGGRRNRWMNISGDGASARSTSVRAVNVDIF